MRYIWSFKTSSRLLSNPLLSYQRSFGTQFREFLAIHQAAIMQHINIAMTLFTAAVIGYLEVVAKLCAEFILKQCLKNVMWRVEGEEETEDLLVRHKERYVFMELNFFSARILFAFKKPRLLCANKYFCIQFLSQFYSRSGCICLCKWSSSLQCFENYPKTKLSIYF